MPYKSISELPASVRNTLPEGAQRIWMNAYNYALANPSKVEGEPAQYAWGAVKRVYEKQGDRWVKKNSLDLSTQEIEDLQLTTADIVDILPKKFWEVPVKYGIRLPPHQGKMMWQGSISSYTSKVDLDEYVGKALHLIEDTVSYGTIRLKKATSIKKDEDEEDEDFIFYVYDIDWLKKFPGPLPLKVRKKEYGIIERKDYSFKMLNGLSNIDLLYMHSYCHSGHNDKIKEFHDLVAQEMKARGLIHPIYDSMDRAGTELPMPKVTKSTEPVVIDDTISLEQFLDMLPDQFSVDAPPPRMWLTGDIVNKGTTTVSEGIDIVIGQDEVDPRIMSKIANLIDDDRVKKSLRIIFSGDGPPAGYSIPLYRDAFQKLGYRVSFDPTDYIRYVSPKDNPYDSLQELWNKWANVRVADGLIVEKRYDGIPVSVHHSPGDHTVLRKYKTDIKLDNIIIELGKIDRPFVCMGTIVQYDCNNIKVNKIEELCTAIPTEIDSIMRLTLRHQSYSDCTVLHLNELLYLDNQPLHNMPYKERIELLDVLIPDTFTHVRKVPYGIAKSKAELEDVVSQIMELSGSSGVIIKEYGSVFNFTGRSQQMVDLHKDSDITAVIRLNDCTLMHEKEICPLYTITHQALAKISIEQLKYPVKCQLASMVRCPLIKDYYYELSEPVEIKNWAMPLSELDSEDTHTPQDQSDQPYTTYRGNGGL